MKSTFKELTAREGRIMHILWKLEEAFVHDIVNAMPSPKPAYNTVSTFIRILEQKGFVGHKAYGRSHAYYPIIGKEKYTRLMMKDVMKGYFNNSLSTLVSFFIREGRVSSKNLQTIQQMVEEALREQPVTEKKTPVSDKKATAKRAKK